MARRKRTPKKPQRLRENQKPCYGISITIPVEGRKHTLMYHEVYLDEAKAKFIRLAVAEGRASEAGFDKIWDILPEGTEVQLMNLTLVWDIWEDKEEGSDE